MGYVDALRSGRWIPDPADRVTVVIEHEPECPAEAGGRCGCVPRLVLQDAFQREDTKLHGREETEQTA
jgi:hypothetical protein